jgi:peptidyl-prolyl cis-trans isomerase SurA
MKKLNLLALQAVVAVAAVLGGVTARVDAQMLSSEPVDRIVAVIDEDVILQSELDRALNNILAQYAGRSQQLPPRDVLERQVLERLIALRLQIQRAEQTGIRVSDSELDQAVLRLAQQNGATLDQLRASLERDGFNYEEFRKTLRDELLVQRMRQRFVQTRVAVTDTEVDILLASGSLRQGEVRLSHILITVPDGATPDLIQTAREKAERVKAELDGGLDFAAAAIRYSDGQQALEGGDLGWRRYEEVPSIFTDLVATMKKGEITQPMRGPSGFHILQLVDERQQSQQLVREFTARHILVRTSELVSSDDAHKSIENIRARIVAGEDFGKLAREFSEDKTSSNQGGDMGWFEQYDYGSRVGDVLASLKDNELSEPFQSEVGWHVMQRIGTREQDRTEEKLRETARETLRTRKSEEEYETFLRQLRAEAYIENRLTDAPDKEKSS